MKLFLACFCVVLSGCIGPAMKYSVNPNSLYSINNGGVNTGNRPVVTETQVIHGYLYLY